MIYHDSPFGKRFAMGQPLLPMQPIAQSREPPYIPFPSESKPLISKAVRQLLEEIRRTTVASLKWESEAGQIELGDQCKEVIKEIDALACAILKSDTVTEEDLADIQGWRNQLAQIQLKLKGALEQQTISPDVAHYMSEGMQQAEGILNQIRHVAEAIKTYQTEFEHPHSGPFQLIQQFCNECDRDPLAAGLQLKPLLDRISSFDKQARTEIGKLESMGSVKLRDLHKMQMESIDQEIEFWVDESENVINNQLQHLRYLINKCSSKEAEEAKKQAAALLVHLEKMSIQASTLVRLPSTQAHLRKLKSMLGFYIDKVKELAAQDSGGLVYGSRNWDYQVSLRRPIPKGLLSRAVSWLNPLSYIPERWRPETKHVLNAVFTIMQLGQEAQGFKGRITRNEELAQALQKEAKANVPKAVAEAVDSEAGLIGNILERGMSGVNLEKVAKRWPEALKTLQAAQVKYGNDLTKEQRDQVIKEHITERTLNPITARWQRLWPNNPVHLIPEEELVQADVAESSVVEEVSPSYATTVPTTEPEETVSIEKPSRSPQPINIAEIEIIARPVIEGQGVVDVVQKLQDQALPSHIHDGFRQINSARERLRHVNAALGPDLTDRYQEEINTWARNIDKVVARLPDPQSSREEVTGWLQTVAEQSCRIDMFLEQVLKAQELDKSKPADAAPVVPAIDRHVQESNQMILEVINQPSEVPSDRIYANLVGLHRVDVKKAKMGTTELERGYTVEAIKFLQDTQKAYLKVLESHPNFSVSCRQESCEAVFGKGPLLDAVAKDSTLVKQFVDKMQFASDAAIKSPIELGKKIVQEFESLKPGDSFVLPLSWAGKKAGHAMMFEVEKDAENGKAIVRIYNLGPGIQYHAMGFGGFIPFREIVNIDPKRLTGGAFTGFRETIAKTLPEIPNTEWDEYVIYDVMLPALGGQVSARKNSAELMRDPQYVGNCFLASVVAVMDKTLVSNSLAERMRALTIYRATKSYYQANLSRMTYGDEREAVRKLMLIGVKATLEAIERAVETGGIEGEAAQELLKGMKQIKGSVEKLEAEDFGALQGATLNLDGHHSWKPGVITFDPTQLVDLTTSVNPATQPLFATSAKLRKGTKSADPSKLATHPPLKSKQVETLIDFGKKHQGQLQSINQAESITPLDVVAVFDLGVQTSRSLLAASSSKALKLTENLALFANNIASYLDVNKLAIIYRLFLNVNDMRHNLASDQHLVTSIIHFCTKGRMLAQQIKNYEMEAFYTSLTRIVGKTIEKSTADSAKLLANFPESTELFSQQIAEKDPVTETDLLKIIHFYRLLGFEGHQSLSVSEAGEYLSSLNYLQSVGYPDDLAMGINAEEAVKSMFEKIDAALLSLKDPNNVNMVLNSIAKGMDSHHIDCAWSFDMKENKYINAEKTMSYDPETGKLTSITLVKKTLPALILNDELFRSIAGNDIKYLQEVQDGMFAYQDSSGINYRFTVYNGKPTTLRKFNDDWCQAVRPELISTIPLFIKGGDLPIIEEGILWMPVTPRGKTYFTTPQDKLLLQLDKDQAQLVQSNLQPTGLELMDPNTSSLGKMLERVEQLPYCLAFGQKGRLAKVKVPRLGLEFVASGTKEVLPSAQLDGFGIFEGMQRIASFGDFDKYIPVKKITLTKDKETGKLVSHEELGVVIPNLRFARHEAGSLATPTAFSSPKEGWDARVPYFFYRLKDGLFVPEASNHAEIVQANIHLATIFLSEHRYEDAVKYLNIVDSLLKSSGKRVKKAMIDRLERLATFAEINDDHSPDAVAIRLRAVSIIQRLINLEQTAPIEVLCDDDYDLYMQHVNRVSSSVRLSQEMAKQVGQHLKSGPLPQPSFHIFPIHHEGSLEQSVFPISRAQTKPAPLADANLASDVVLDRMGQAGRVAIAGKALFVSAFPEGVIPLYKFLKNPDAVSKLDIARMFGLDPTIDSQSMKTSMLTLLEIRYRYIIDHLEFLKAQMSPPTPETEIDLMQSEVNLLGAMLWLTKNDASAEGEIERDAKHYRDLVGALRANEKYKDKVNAYDALQKEMTDEAKSEALRLWEAWINPKAMPIPLTMEKAVMATTSFVGPIKTRPMLSPVLSKLDETRKITPDYYPPALILHTQPLMTRGEIESFFTVTSVKTTPTTSPFGVKAKDPLIGDVFTQYDQQCKDFASTQPPAKFNYALKQAEGLQKKAKLLQTESEQHAVKYSKFEELLTQKLNIAASGENVRAHVDIRQARGSTRQLTLADAKAAVARGWDVKHLQSLNPSLKPKDIQEIFDLTFKMMLEKREVQRITRIIDAIKSTLETPTSSPDYQIKANHLMNASEEGMYYDPHKHPVLLLAETEFDLALWREQIPAIIQLGPQDQVSALVELAMAMGKTDVISPVVLCLLADGKTLPIIVTSDALLPAMASRLQQRIGAFDMEIRAIPIKRGVWTVEKIDALREELETMVEQRVPLAWSSTDIQTIFNSDIEDKNEMDPSKPSENMMKVRAWAKLFTFLSTSSVIVGDEIHAILDILTSYSFSEGTPQPMSADEMDASADFIQVAMTHPAVVNKVSMPSRPAPVPLTEQYFATELAPKIIETLIQRGITNDPRSKELFTLMDKKKVDQVRSYLASTKMGAKERFDFLPSIPIDVIDRLESGYLSINSREVTNLINALLPSDRQNISEYGDNVQLIAPFLRVLASEYKKLDQRIHNFLAVQKEGLRTVFTLTCTAQVGKHYVMNRDGDGAIPADNGTPLWDAQFGSSLERLFYTAFLFFQNKLSKDLVKEDLQNFVDKYRLNVAEMLEEIIQTGTVEPNTKNEELVESFQQRYGTKYSLSEKGFTHDEVEQITAWVNERPESQLILIREHLFPQQLVYPEEIRTTTHLFPLIAKPNIGLKGTSGTLFNRATYPKVFERTQLSDTIPSVIQKIKENGPATARTVSFEGSIDEVVKNIYENSPLGSGSIIDTTGYIRKENTEEYARAMLRMTHQQNPTITGIVYYEGDTQRVVSIDRKESFLYDPSMNRDSLMALWEVAHTFGANIIINRNAGAKLIVGKHIRLFEMTQAAMRLRSLGAGQNIEVVVPESDRPIIVDKLFKNLGIKIPDGQPLTVDQVFQYALLNEILQETDNNWRSVEMRMRMAIIEPTLKLVWNESTPPENAFQIFSLIKSLFINKRSIDPWDQYGGIITKTDVNDALQTLLKGMKEHPVLTAIEQNPHLFPGIKVTDIHKKMDDIAADQHGPLQRMVDSETYLGLRQQVKNKAQVKVKAADRTVVNLKAVDRNKVKEKLQEAVKKFDHPMRKAGISLKREPYHPRPIIPPAEKPFSRASYNVLPIQEAATMHLHQLQPAELTKRQAGAAISAKDLLGLDPALRDVIQLPDDNISFSLNIAPVWVDETGATPLYKPYHFFQKIPSHALLIHDRATDTMKLRLLDQNDAQAVLEQLKQDRDNPIPDAEREVNLSVYHLKENRIVASGSTPANPDQMSALQEQTTALISQAKLLSGITHYTPKEASVLKQWMSRKKPMEILKKFILKIALHREDSLSLFPKSRLAKIFKDLGITDKQIEDLLNDKRIVAAKEIRKLLFDLSHDRPGMETAKLLSDTLGPDLKEFAAEWSELVVPLLPLMHHIEYVRTENLHGFRSGAITPVKASVFRRWIMNTFFPTVGDEYGAWRTAVPQMAGMFIPENISNLERINRLISEGSYGNDADATFLKEAFNAIRKSIQPVSVPVDQLESMTELANPTYGLPLIVGHSGGDFRNVAIPLKRMLEVQTDSAELLPEQVAEISTKHGDLAVDIAKMAIAHVDLPASLSDLFAKQENYEFERLFGLFRFLVHQGGSENDRREYGLHLLRRLVSKQFDAPLTFISSDTRFYSEYIPQHFTVNSEAYPKSKIEDMLKNCYKAAITTPELDRPHFSHYDMIISAFKRFTNEAPQSVAAITANTMNELFRTHVSSAKKPEGIWWMDEMVLQMMRRTDRLIEHQAYKDYFEKMGVNVNHMISAFSRGVTPNLNANDIYVLRDMLLNDFDLFADLAKLNTANAPSFTPYQMADKWSKAFEDVKSHPRGIYTPARKELWLKIIGPIAEAVKKSPPTRDEDKKSLLRLWNAIDKYNTDIEWKLDAFDLLPNELGTIRMAATCGFETANRKQSAIDEIKSLFNKQPRSIRIFLKYIEDSLLTEDVALTFTSSDINSLFQDLSMVNNVSARDWKGYLEWHFRRIALGGNNVQRQHFLDWTNNALRKGGLPENAFNDGAVLNVLVKEPQQINYHDLANYAKGREQAFSDWLAEKDTGLLKNPRMPFRTDDFELFVELEGLKVADRPNIPYQTLAEKLTTALSKWPKELADKTETQNFWIGVLDQVRYSAPGQPMTPQAIAVISNLVKALDSFYASASTIMPGLVTSVNALRLMTAFAGTDHNANLLKALQNDLTDSPHPRNLEQNCYKELIPILIQKTTNNDWMRPALNEFVSRRGQAPLTIEDQGYLLNLFLLSGRHALLPSLLNQIIPTLSTSSSVITYLITKLTKEEFTQIESSVFESYFKKCSNDERQTIVTEVLESHASINLWNEQSGFSTVWKTNSVDFNSFAASIGIKMKNAPNPSIESLTLLMKGFAIHAKDIKKDELIKMDSVPFSTGFKELIKLAPTASQQDKINISGFIKFLDIKIPSYDKSLNELRKLVDYPGPAEQNMRMAVKQLSEPDISYTRVNNIRDYLGLSEWNQEMKQRFIHEFFAEITPTGAGSKYSILFSKEIISESSFRDFVILFLENDSGLLSATAAELKLQFDPKNSQRLPPNLMKILFETLLKAGKYLDFETGHQMWLNLPKDMTREKLKEMFDKVRTSGAIEFDIGLISTNYFPMLSKVLGLRFTDSPSLTQLIDNATLILSDGSNEASLLINTLVANMPSSSFLRPKNTVLSQGEKEALQRFMKIGKKRFATWSFDASQLNEYL